MFCHYRENALQRLAPIKLAPVPNIRPQSPMFYLLELFANSSGGQEARKMFAKIGFNEEAMAHWHFSLLPFVSNLRYTLYPFIKINTLIRVNHRFIHFAAKFSYQILI